MQIKTFYNNPFQEACHVLSDNGTAVIIDCGAYTTLEERRIEQYLIEQQLTPIAHLLTHGHLDHVFGAKWLYTHYGLTPILHPADEELFLSLNAQAALFGLPLNNEGLQLFTPLNDELILPMGLSFIHTPGHTPGGVCYRTSNILFTGDTLFQCGFGRTDLPGGDARLLYDSLKKLFKLPQETIVYPGHGYPTTIGDEKM